MATTAKKLKLSLFDHIDDMTDIVNNTMKHDGDTEAESQRMCLINALGKLEAVINGIELSDIQEAS